jgi:hypothetical protein
MHIATPRPPPIIAMAVPVSHALYHGLQLSRPRLRPPARPPPPQLYDVKTGQLFHVLTSPPNTDPLRPWQHK